jgi:hypothetical protein
MQWFNSTVRRVIWVVLGVLVCARLFAQEPIAPPLSNGIPADPEKFHIFLLLGQSNMEGRSSVDGEMDKEIHPRVLKLNSWNSWQPAVDPITNNASVAVGPGLAFAKAVADADPDVTVGLISLAVGGTPIAKWVKGGEYYNGILHAAAVARQHGVVKGILWHQGEHDAIFNHTAVAYGDNLKGLINDLRMDLNDVELPFLIGGFGEALSSNRNHSYSETVSNRLKYVGTTFHRCAYVRAFDLPFTGDHIHFTTESQRILGGRYAEQYLHLSGHWLREGKKRLDASAELLEDGWKSSPILGRYQDDLYPDQFPYVKHAQLGWLKVNFYGDGSMSLFSAVNGKFRTYPDNGPDGLYFYRENSDPEKINEPGDIFFVRFDTKPGDAQAIYSHATSTWMSALEGTPDYSTMEGIYFPTEDQFVKTQQARAELISYATYGKSWSEITKILREAEVYRIFTILHAVDSYHFAAKNMTKPVLRNFWLEQSWGIISRIDSVLIEAQDAWLDYTEMMLGH